MLSMSKKSDKEHFSFVLEKILDLESYIERYGKISNMLEDKLGKDGALMCLLQIGETLNKLNNSYNELDIKEIKGSYDVRNFIAHDYMGVDLGLVEIIIKVRIPTLKEIVQELLKK